MGKGDSGRTKAIASSPMRSGGRSEEGSATDVLVTTVDPLAAELRKAFALFFMS
jgi:hypothetical protein